MKEDKGQGQVQGLSSEDCSAIIEHMNVDHADAVLLYAKAFGGLAQATAAVMTDIDSFGMALDVTCGSKTERVRIAFDHALKHPGDARRILAEMATTARRICNQI
ncbi:MAG: DUF2470 domain-containing protein [Acidiferrobacterales bacterium]